MAAAASSMLLWVLAIRSARTFDDGTLSLILVTLLVQLPFAALFMLWIVRPRFVVKRLGSWEEVDAVIDGSRDLNLRNRLVWVEFAMARDTVLNGERSAIPREYWRDAREIEWSMWIVSWPAVYALTGSWALLGLVALGVGIFFVVHMGSDGFFLGLMGFVALICFTWARRTVAAARKPEADIGRRVLSSRSLPPSLRRARLTEAARDYIQLEQDRGTELVTVEPADRADCQ